MKPGNSKNIATAIAGFKDWDKVKEELELIDKYEINIVTYQDELYPAKLLEIYDRPPLLFVKGNLKKDDVNISIVGSRLASTYGKYTTEKNQPRTCPAGSNYCQRVGTGYRFGGTSRSIDGSGTDNSSPGQWPGYYLSTRKQEIICRNNCENGAVVSEFPLGTPPRACNFPARNRIISGMSYGVVVVEAGEKSGSLITARLALEQGREVFAVPGSIDSAGSRGTNKLIKQGAKLIENTDDILEEILPQLEKTKIPETQSVSNSETIAGKMKYLNSIDRQIIGFYPGTACTLMINHYRFSAR